MDSRSTAAEPKLSSFPQSPWTHSPSVGPTTPTANGSASQSDSSTGPLSSKLEYFPPYFLPHQQAQATFFHQQQLLQYNKLVSAGRGGGQPQLLSQASSSPHIQPAPRSRSASKASNRDHPTGKGTQGGHGSKGAQNTDRAHRSGITNKDPPLKMGPKNSELSHPLPARPPPPNPSLSHSSSVPSTPLQHARNFSFESRDPSPNANANHSPRSAYSETTAQVPPLRQLPPKLGSCPYETAQVHSRRRIPYSIEKEKLEKVDASKIKSKLSEDDERRLTTDMRELYDRLLPTSAVETSRGKLVTKLEKIFNDEWPGHDIRVHLFGSSGNLLCSDDSDVDICITTEWKEMESVCMIADLLAKRGMEKVVCISAAKVPIVKIWDPELKLACDMNVNNTLALENTRMVRTYVELDERVRPLAMIIKYWARRRIINDAGLGGTLSSYTWICLIIAFLQLREPPIVSALHQRQHQRLSRKDGTKSEFADDVEKLRSFGRKNKSTLGELLFQFFRFYAHEFDYDKHALSVRLGKQMTKKEKNWHHALNNKLCIEEPFNTSRNLGNTADDYSFKGIHLELRRAFDAIAKGNLDECCEQFVFPKEEERTFTHQPRNPQPVLIRSASQTHSSRSRGGYGRNGRNNFNYRGNGSNRRASSSVPFEANNNVMYPQQFPAQDLPWMVQPAGFTPEMMLHMFTQSQLFAQVAYSQQPSQPQPQAPVQGHQRGPAKTPASQAGSERSRTNSIDTAPAAPLSAPLRHDMYGMYALPFQGGATAYFPAPVAAGFGTYPSSPATTANGATAEFRRSLHRTSAAAEAGSAAAGSSLRSQSQPASRTMPSAQTGTGFNTPGSALPNGLPMFPPPRNVAGGIRFPNFVADETDYDESPKARADTPPSDDGAYLSYSLSEASSPHRRAVPLPNGISFGDLHHQQPVQDCRRLSTELPQAVLGHGLGQSSRSPSPNGHIRTLSAGTSAIQSAPLASAPFPTSNNGANLARPLVVNGSTQKSPLGSSRQASGSESLASDDFAPSGYDNALHIGGAYSFVPGQEQHPALSVTSSEKSPQPVLEQPPVIVNGSNQPTPPGSAATAGATDASAPLAGNLGEPNFRDRVATMAYFIPQGMHHYGDPTLTAGSSPTRQRLIRPQGGVMEPLDLAIRDYKMAGASPVNTDLQHLSPVYEGNTPSPTALRKFEPPLPKKEKVVVRAPSKDRSEGSKMGQRGGDSNGHGQQEQKPSGSARHSQQKSQAANKSNAQAGQAPKPQLPPRAPMDAQEPNGDPRGPKHETMNTESGWQKAGKGRRKGNDAKQAANGHLHGETPPKYESERKGG